MARETRILDGRGVADLVLKEVTEEVALLAKKGMRQPGLCTILVGEHSASAMYVKNKRKRATQVGIQSFHHELAENVSESHLLELIAQLNDDPHVDGILVQLPLPKHIDEAKIIEAIDPKKDVDGFHPSNMGRLLIGSPGLVPCTPLGCIRILEEAKVKLHGANAVVVGRSNIVGKPMAALLLNADATVTICHRHSRNIKDLTKLADVLIVAVGKPNLITGDHIKDGATVIDVGINRLEDGSIVGDVETSSVLGKAGVLTPVPGGVGPMTIAILLSNTLLAYHLRNKS